MYALQLPAWKSDAVLVEVPDPHPGPGEVVVRIGGAGACHSDLHLMHDFDAGILPWAPPFTLGHENAGWVHELGAGVTGWRSDNRLPSTGRGDAEPAHAASSASRPTARTRQLLAPPAEGVDWVSTAEWPSTCWCRRRVTS
jgi:NADPH:quinone reductase-like Zn-dependent oxidoreductase